MITGSKNRITSEELLVPNGPARVDPYRLVMWASNIPQIIPLTKTEIPRIHTGFENQVGAKSKGISYITANGNGKIIKRIEKYPGSDYYDLIIEKEDTTRHNYKDESGKITMMNKKTYDLISVRPVNKLTENYGYKMNTVNKKKDGDKIKDNELIVSSSEYDEHLNMKYGQNAKVAYSPYNNGTFEDSIVISETFSKRMSTYRVEKTVSLLPSNVILINHESTQRALWKVGEVIDDNLLTISRTINDNLLVSSSNNSAISEPRYSDRRIYTNGGKVVDIEIFAKKEQVKGYDKKGGFYKEIHDIYETNKKYYLSIINTLEELDLYPRDLDEKGNPDRFIEKINLKHFTTPELDFLYKEAKEWLNEDSVWLTSKSEPINTIALRYTILKEYGLETGGKLIGRYGDKGVTSFLILEDENMPYYYNHLGEKKYIDVFLNFLGIWGRQNPAQLFEQHVSFLMDNLADKCRIIENEVERQTYFFDIISRLDSNYGKFMFDEYKKLKSAERKEFWEDVFNYKFPFVMDPFEDVLDWNNLTELQKEFPDLTRPYETSNGRKIIVGDKYIVRLKHDAENKSSVRSTGKGSVVDGTPVDSKKERKIKQKLLSDKSARFGVMEKLNLEILNDKKILSKFYAMNGLSQEARTDLVKEILIKGEIFSNSIDMEEFLSNKTNTRRVLDAYLDVLNLKIED